MPRFDQQSLPVLIEERGLGKKLKWTVDIETLNYGHILPIFFAGIQEKQDPYRFVAFEGKQLCCPQIPNRLCLSK